MNGEGDNSAANDHRGSVESRDGDCRPEVPAHERGRRLVAGILFSRSADTEIDGQQQARAMRRRDGEGPECQLCRLDTAQEARMAAGDQQVGAPAAMTKSPAPMRISRCHATRAVIAAKGASLPAIARKCPAPSGPSDAIRSRRPLPINPAETANGQPIPGLTP
jgi:hypothetical protein